MLRLSCFSAALALVALSPTAAAQTPIQFRADAATFQYAEDEALVEVYLSFRAASLPFERADAGFLATVPARIRLVPSSMAGPSGTQREAVYDQTLAFPYALDDTTGLTDEQVLVEQVRFLAPPGEYEMEVTITPQDGPTVGAVVDLALPDYASTGGTAISALQLATTIGRAEEGDPMSKSGLSIRPNPDAYYGGASAPVQYYAEVYNPPSESETYTVLAFLAESATGAPMPDLERRVERRVRPVDIAVGAIDVQTVPSGIYYLRLVVLDASNQSVAEQSKRLFIINPDVVSETDGLGAMTYEETLFEAMGEEELALNVRHAFVVASQRERQQIAQLSSDDERRGFLTTFWTDRDQNASPTVNDARRTFYERLVAVNDRFGEPGGKVGFETDRGRIYLTYGPPSELDRRPFDTQYSPHEVWTYENIPGEGRSVFVFVDRYSAAQYELIHSDVTGEVSVPNWQTEVLR